MVPPSTVEPMRAMSLLAARPAVGEEEEEPEDVLLCPGEGQHRKARVAERAELAIGCTPGPGFESHRTVVS